MDFEKLLEVEEEENESISLNNITSKESLDKAVKQMIDSFTANEFEILEVHKFTQILPEKFYEPGSHLLNRQVAFALKNTDDRLFLSWVQLRSKASDFDYSTIPEFAFRRSAQICIFPLTSCFWVPRLLNTHVLPHCFSDLRC